MSATTTTRADLRLWRESVRSRALSEGFSLAAFTTADPLDRLTRERRRRWLEAGRAGAMRYLHRDRPRRTHPRDLLPEAQCALVVAAAYYDGDHPKSLGGRAKIARYAWGEDYHGVVRGRLASVAEAIAAEAPERGFAEPVAWRAVSDSAPLDERALAARAGIGFIGKNTLLINDERGSWFLLGVLLLSIPFPPDEPEPMASCGACRRCLDACPTDAFVGAYRLDATRCISYLTIEQREAIPEEFAGAMDGWAFGCDVCQEVCPFNDAPLARRLPELAAERGIGPTIGAEELARIDSGKAYLRKWGHTPLERAGWKGMRRNIEAALGAGAKGREAK